MSLGERRLDGPYTRRDPEHTRDVNTRKSVHPPPPRRRLPRSLLYLWVLTDQRRAAATLLKSLFLRWCFRSLLQRRINAQQSLRPTTSSAPLHSFRRPPSFTAITYLYPFFLPHHSMPPYFLQRLSVLVLLSSPSFSPDLCIILLTHSFAIFVPSWLTAQTKFNNNK